MLSCDTLIRKASVLDGSGSAADLVDVALCAGRICAVGTGLAADAATVMDGSGLVLAPGFIDVHTR
jgi:N-acyl-D-amino-acid deacylase